MAEIARPDSDEGEWTLMGSGSNLIGGEVQKELDEIGYRKLRAQAERLYRQNPHAKSIIRNLVKYVLGKGVSIVAWAEAGPDDDAAKKEWEAFEKRNNWTRKQKELVRRAFLSGECFINYEDVSDGKEKTTRIHFIEPDWIRSNDDKITHGIETAQDDVEDIISYRFLPPDSIGVKAEEKILLPNDVQHVKIDVDDNVKRGRSILEPVLKRLTGYDKFLEAREILNRARTSIVMHRQVTGAGSQIQSNVVDKYKNTSTTQGSGTYQRAPKPGTVITTSKDVDIKFLSPNLGAGEAEIDGRMLLLAIAAGVGLAEYMVTADSSNSNFACVDEDTEILTDKGWLKYEHLDIQTEGIATVNPLTFNLEYHKAKHKFVYDYDGEVVHFKNNHTDLMVTPNHQLFIQSSSKRPWQFKRADQINGRPIAMPAGINEAIETNEIKNMVLDNQIIDGDTWLEFIGYVIAEGGIQNTGFRKTVVDGKTYQRLDYCVTITHTEGQKADLIKYCLAQLPYHINTQERKTRTGKTYYLWRIYDKTLWTWVKDNVYVGERRRKWKGGQDKTIPLDYLNLCSRQTAILFNALILGDAHIRQIEPYVSGVYTSKYKDLADRFQIIAFKLGYTTKLYNDNFIGTVYRIGFWKQYTVRLGESKSVIPYKGKVWCVEVPNHLFVTRRNGFISITGNSTLVAEAPAVKEIEDWQEFFKEVFCDVYRRVIQRGKKAGRVPESVSEECDWQFPPIVSRNELQEAQSRNILRMNGIISKTTFAAKSGLDYKEELELMAKEQEEEFDFEDEEEDFPPGTIPKKNVLQFKQFMKNAVKEYIEQMRIE